MLTAIQFTPPWLKKAKGKNAKPLPVFKLRPGTVLEREAFEGEMDGRYRAGQIAGFQLRDAALAGIDALMPGDEGAALKEIVLAEYDDPTALSPEERAKVRQVGEVLAEHWPDYGALNEQDSRRNALLPLVAFVRFCDGWENLFDESGEPIAFERDAKGDIPDEVLRQVPRLYVRAAGIEAYELLYGRAQAKN